MMINLSSTVIPTQFMIEGLVVAILAWLIAVPLSVGLAYLVTPSFTGDTTFSFPSVMSIAGLVSVLIVAVLASIWPSMQASRKTVSEIFRYQ